MPRAKKTKPKDIKRIQLPDGRWYEYEGKKNPSVTTLINIIAKPSLVFWSANQERILALEAAVDFYRELSGASEAAGKEYLKQLETRMGYKRAHQRLLEEAGDIGTQTHNRIEWELREELGLNSEFDARPELTSTGAEKAYNEWKKWRKDVNLKVIAVEQMIISEKYGYGGTLDLLAEIEGVLTVPDWKTGKRIYAESFLQNAAYRQAVREMGIGDPKKGIIVRLPKLEDDPGFEVADAGDEEYNFKIFLNTRELWEWQRETRKILKEKE